MNDRETIRANIIEITKKVNGRARILAATKTVPAELINYAADCGITLIGENRVNELLEKYDAIDKSRLEIHFIGGLQTNKVKYIIDKVSMIHSLDRYELACEIEKQAQKHNIGIKALVEVNIANEETKSGIEYERVGEFLSQMGEFPHIKVCGLMAIPPKSANTKENDYYFEKINKLFIDNSGKKADNVSMNVLSLGMSGDFEQAIEHGSNLVRLGSCIFGERTYTMNSK